MPASRAYLVTSRFSDSGVITASSSISNATPSNLQLHRPSLYWQATNTTPYLEIDLLSARTFDTIFMGYVEGKSGDTFRIRDASSQGNLTAAPDYDSNTLNPSGIPVWPTGSDLSPYLQTHRTFALPSTRTNRWVRIDFNFSVAGYVKLSRLGIGKRIEPATSVKAGWVPKIAEPIAETIDMGGEESSRVMGSRRSLMATWHDLTHEEQDMLLAVLTERGSSRDLLLAIDPSEGKYPMSHLCLGRVKQEVSFPQTMKVEPDEDGEHFTVSITVSELKPIDMV